MPSRMASCGATSIMLHPVTRRGCNWTQVKLLNPVFRSSSSSSSSRISVFNQRPGLAAVHCLSSEKRRLSNVLWFPGRVNPTRAQQLHISSALDELNEEQKAAVQTQEDCVRVVAGPGSGKTLVLTHRIAHLIEKRGINPANMLCLTFTNKAKEELQQRLCKLLGDSSSPKLTIGTFHSVCVKMLRESASKEDVGVNKDFVIYDDLDCGKLVKKILGEKQEESMRWREDLTQESEENGKVSKPKKKKTYSLSAVTVQETFEQITQIKEFDLRSFIAKQNHSHMSLKMPEKLKATIPEFNRYQSMMRSYNAVDFDDLIYLTVRLLYKRSDLSLKYQKRWSYVLADEFQDTDWAQYVLVRLLCATNQKLFVVGDVDQAIYGWRGADYRNMEDLERHFQGLTTFELRRNYRSSQRILKLASEVISRSQRPAESMKRLTLQAMKPRGAPVTIACCLSSEEEAAYVMEKICRLVDRKEASYGSFGILYRTRMQGHTFERLCIADQIPYTISGSSGLLSYKEVKDLRAYLQLIWNPEDGVALDRVINTPPRGLGPKTLQSVQEWAFNLNLSFPRALQKILDEEPSHKVLGITSRARNSLLDFCKLQGDLLRLSSDATVSELMREVIDRTEMLEHQDRLDENFGKRESHLSLFQGLAKSMEGEHGCGRSALCLFLEALALNVDLKQEDDKTLDAVKLSTLHAAKGLEFDYVFIVGVENGTLPSAYNDLEEERRLFYVGVTRARKELVITSRRGFFVPGVGFQHSRGSEFLDLPLHLYKQESFPRHSLKTHVNVSQYS